MARLDPYLFFEGTCKEAFSFYKEIFGGELSIMLTEQSPIAEMLKDQEGKVMHAYLRTESFVLMGSDNIGGEDLGRSRDVQLCLNDLSREECTRLFERLSAGGQVSMPLKEEFFGLHGQCIDRFGKTWMFQAK